MQLQNYTYFVYCNIYVIFFINKVINKNLFF